MVIAKDTLISKIINLPIWWTTKFISIKYLPRCQATSLRQLGCSQQGLMYAYIWESTWSVVIIIDHDVRMQRHQFAGEWATGREIKQELEEPWSGFPSCPGNMYTDYYDTCQDVKPFAALHKARKRDGSCYYDANPIVTNNNYWESGNDCYASRIFDEINNYNVQMQLRDFQHRPKYPHYGFSKLEFTCLLDLRYRFYVRFQLLQHVLEIRFCRNFVYRDNMPSRYYSSRHGSWLTLILLKWTKD